MSVDSRPPAETEKRPAQRPRPSASSVGRRIGWALLAPVAAVVFAAIISTIILMASGYHPLTVYNDMYQYGTCLRSPGFGNACQPSQSFALIVDDALPLYLSGVAVAIGFQMNLFNIGVEGQYRIAALLAAAVGAHLGGVPSPIALTLILLVAMASGAVWSGIAGALKTTRGVSEVISTIMLNYVATGVTAYLLAHTFSVANAGNNLQTPTLPKSARFPNFGSPPSQTFGMVIVAVVIGVLYWFTLSRTRFGFDLRASGLNPFAAVASGVSARSMVFQTMLISGAIAGLVGLPFVLNYQHAFTTDVPTGLGFTGIAVALLGRNNPIGIAIGALLFGFLDTSAQVLDLQGVPKEIVQIIEGVIVLSVVVAYEAVRRVRVAQAERAVSRQTDDERVSEVAA